MFRSTLCLHAIVAILISTLAPTARAALALVAGDVQTQNGGYEILLEDGYKILWPSSGPLTLYSTRDDVKIDIDLQKTNDFANSTTESSIVESDLGGKSTAKKYLRGKKNPQGRKLGSNALSQPGAQDKQIEAVVAGVKIISTESPNGAKALEWIWPDHRERLSFDRRSTLISSERIRDIGNLKHTFLQWAGAGSPAASPSLFVSGGNSYTQLYERAEGQVQYIFDSQSQSYRLLFNDPQGINVARANCSYRREAQSSITLMDEQGNTKEGKRAWKFGCVLE